MDIILLKQFGIAVVLSGLIGIEREKKYLGKNTLYFGGVRTFPLVGFLGALACYLYSYSVVYTIIVSLAVVAFLVTTHVMIAIKSGDVGLTSEIAAMIAYLIGVLCVLNQFFVAVSAAMVVLILLQFRDTLHNLVGKIQNEEIVSTIEFVLIAFVILPLLPNKDFGPYGFFNPYMIWLMVVFISGISFLSYIAIKILGTRRGIVLTGFLAGFISSTALTFSFSAQSKKNKKIVRPYVIAVVVASSAMFFRVLLEVLVLNRELFSVVFFPLFTMGVLGFLSAFYLFVRKDKIVKSDGKMPVIQSPFSLFPAIKFGTFFSLVLLVSKFALANFGNLGLYLTSFFSGLLDVDAITVSMANLSTQTLAVVIAGTAIAVASITNTLFKSLIFFLMGSRKVALQILVIFILMILAGGAVFGLSIFF